MRDMGYQLLDEGRTLLNTGNLSNLVKGIQELTAVSCVQFRKNNVRPASLTVATSRKFSVADHFSGPLITVASART